MRRNLLNDTALRLTLGSLLLTQMAPSLAAQSIASSPPIEISGGGASLDVSPGGTPIVVIDTPDQDGVSHNLFRKFNVNREGVIINNSQDVAQSVLGGFVLGNPNLKAAGREADLVIAEVLNGDRSNLAGALEILGTSAGFILANPAGITCDGCGFVNIPHVTLSTGSVQFGADGRFSGLQVTQGDVKVEGAGLLGGNVDFFDIVALSTQINADLFARDLTLSSGAQQFDVRLREARSLARQGTGIAIDSSLLGGMYANRIRLIGNDLGVGINLQGEVASLEGAVEIAADGDVVVGSLQAAEDVALTSHGANISVDGNVYAGGDAGLSAEGNISLNDGFVGAGGDVDLSAGGNVSVTNGAVYAGLAEDGQLTGDGAVTATVGQTVDLEASRILAAGTVAVAAQNIGADETSLVGGNQLSLNATDNLNSSGFFSSTQGLVIEGGKLVSVKDAQAGSTLTIAGQDIAISGEAVGVDSAAVTASNSLTLSEEAALLTNGAVTLKAAEIDNAGGILGVESITADASDTITNAGSMATGGGLAIASVGKFQTSGQLSAHSAVNISAGEAELGGTIVSDDGIDVGAGTISVDGVLSAQQNVTIQSDSSLQTGAESSITAIADLSLDASNIDLAGEIFSGEALSVEAGNGLTSNAILQSVGQADVSAASIVLGGELRSNAAVTLQTPGSISLDGVLTSAVGLSLDAEGAIDTSAATQLISSGALRLTSAAALTHGGLASAAGATLFDAADSLTVSGTISSNDSLDLQAVNQLIVGGITESGENLRATASAINWTGGAIALGSLSLDADKIDLGTDSSLQAVNDVDINANSALTGLGNIVGEGDITLTTDGFAELDGVVQSVGNLTLSASEISSSADLLALGTLDIISRTDLQSSGSLTAARALTISGQQLNFTSGSSVQSEQDIAVTGTAISATGDWLSFGDIAIVGDSLDSSASLSAQEGISLTLTDSVLISSDALLAANGTLDIATSGFSNAGTLTAVGDIGIIVEDIDHSGTAASAGAIDIQATNRLGSSGDIEAAGAINLSAGETIDLAGTLLSTDVVSLSADMISLAGAVQAENALDITANKNILIANTGAVFAGGSLQLDAGTSIQNSGTISALTGVTIGATDDITNLGLIESGGNINLSGSNIELHGTLQAIGSIALDAPDSVSIDALIRSNGALAVQTGNLTSTAESDTAAAGNIDLTADNIALDGLWNSGGTFNAVADEITVAGFVGSVGNLSAKANALLGLTGELASEGEILLVSPTIDLDGSVSAVSTINIDGETVNTGPNAAVQTAGVLQFASETSLTFEGFWAGGEGVNISTAGDLSIAGQLESGTTAILQADDTLDISGSLLANSDIDLTAGAIMLDGVVESGGGVSLTAETGGQTIAGTVTALGDIEIVSADTLTVSGALAGDGAVSLAATQIEISGTAFGNNLTIDAGGGTINAAAGAVLESAEQITLTGQTLTSEANIASNDSIIVGAFSNANIGGALRSNIVEISSETTNVTGLVSASDRLSVSSESFVANSAAELLAGSLLINATGNIENDGLLFAENIVSLIAADSLNNTGNIEGLGTADFSAQNVTLGGIVNFVGALGITAQSNANLLGTIASGGEISVSAADIQLAADALLYGSSSSTLEAASNLDLSGEHIAVGTIQLTGSDIDVTGLVSSDNDLHISASDALDVSGTLFAGGLLEANSQTANLSGTVASLNNIGLASGQISTSTGSFIQSDADIVLTSTGTQDIAGAILALGSVTQDAGGDLSISGNIEAAQDVQLTTQANLTGNGSVLSSRSLAASANNVDWSGEFLSGGIASLDAIGSVTLDGDLLANGAINLAGDSLDLNGAIISDTSVSVVATSGNISGIISAGEAASLTFSDDLSVGADAIIASGTAVTIAALSAENLGQIAGNQNVTLSLTGDLTNAGQIESGGTVNVVAGGDIISSGNIIALGNIALNGDLVNLPGSIETDGMLSVSTDQLSIGGSLSAGQALNLNSTGSITTATASEILSGNVLSISAGSDLLTNGLLYAAVAANLDAIGDLTIAGDLQSDDIVDLSADALNISGNIVSLSNIALDSNVLNVSGTLGTDGRLDILANSANFAATSELIGATALNISSTASLNQSGYWGTNGDISVAAGDSDFAGSVFAGGDLSLTTTGNLEQSGDWVVLGSINADLTGNALIFGSVFAGSEIKLNAQQTDVGEDALVEALGNISITSESDLNVDGAIAGGQALSLNSANAIALSGSELVAAGPISLSSTGQLASNGIIESGDSISIMAGAATLFGQISTAGPLAISSTSGNVSLSGDIISLESASIFSADQLNITGLIQTDKTLTLEAVSGNISGRAYGLDSINVDFSGDLTTETNSELASLGNITVTANSIESAGLIDASGSLSANIGSTIINSGTIVSIGTLALNSDGFSNSGTIASDNNLSITSAGVLNQNGLVYSLGQLRLEGLSNGQLNGTTYGDSNLTIDIAGNIDGDTSPLLASAGNVAITGGNINLAGTIDAGGTLDIVTGGQLTLSGISQSIGKLALSGAQINLNGNLFSEQNAVIKSTGALDINREISALNGLDLTGQAITAGSTTSILTNGTITVNADSFTSQALISGVGDINISATDISLSNMLETAGHLDVQATQALNLSGNIEAGNGVSLTGGDIGLDGGLLSIGAMDIAATGGITLSADAELIAIGDGLQLLGDTINLGGGSVEAQGDILVQTQAALSGAVTLISNGNVTLDAGGMNSANGEVFATGDLLLTGSGINTDLAATALGQLIISSDVGDINLAGAYQSVGMLQIDAARAISLAESSVFGGDGIIYSESSVNLSAQADITNFGTIAAEEALSIESTTLIDNRGILSGDSLLFNAPSFSSTGTLISGQGFDLTGDDLAIVGGLISGGDINLRSLSGDLTIDAELAALNINLASDLGGISINSGSMLSAQEAIDIVAAQDIFADTSIAANLAISISSANGYVTLTDKASLQSLDDITISADLRFISQGLIAATGPISLTADTIQTGTISSDGNITLAAENGLQINGIVDSLSAITASTTNGGADISADAGLVAATSLTVNAGGGAIDSAGLLIAGYTETNGVESYGGSLALSAGNLNLGGFVGADMLSLDAASLTVSGTVLADGNLSFTGNALAISSTGHLHNDSALDFTLPVFDNQGNLTSGAGISLTTAGALNNAGTIAAEGALALNALGSLTSSGILSTGGTLNLAGTSIQLDGQIVATSDIIASTGNLDIGGTLVSEAAISLTSSGRINITTDASIDAASSLDLQAINGASIAGTVVSDGLVNVDSGTMLNVSGQLASFDTASTNAVSLSANRIEISGLAQSGSGIILTSGAGDIQIGGQLIGQANVALNSGAGDITTGAGAKIFAGQSFTASGAAINSAGSITAINSISLTSQNRTIRGGTLLSNGNINLAAGTGTILLDAGSEISGDNVTLTGSNPQIDGDIFASGSINISSLAGTSSNLSVGGQLTALGDITANFTSSSSADVTISAAAGNDYSIYAGGNLSLTGLDSLSSNGLLIGEDSVTLQTSGDMLLGGLESNGKIGLTFADGIISGDLLAGDDVTAIGNNLTISGSVQSLRDIDLTLANDLSISNAGLIYAAEDLNIITEKTYRQDGIIGSGGNTDIQSGVFNLGVNSEISAEGNISIHATGNNITDPNIDPDDRASAVVAGSIQALGSINLSSAVDQSKITGQVLSDDVVSISSTSAVVIGDQRIALDPDQFGGTLISSNSLVDIQSTGHNIVVYGGTIESGDRIILDANTADISLGTIFLLDHATIQSAGNARSIGLTSSNGNGANITLTGKAISNEGSIITDGSIFISGGAANGYRGAGSITALGELVLRSDNGGVNIGTVLANGDIFAGSLALYQKDAFTNTGSFASANNLLISAASIDNSGLLAANGNLTLVTPGGITNTGTLFSGADLTLNSTGDLINDEGLILALGDIDIDAAGVANLSGTIETLGGSIDINAGSLTNRIKSLVIANAAGTGGTGQLLDFNGDVQVTNFDYDNACQTPFYECTGNFVQFLPFRSGVDSLAESIDDSVIFEFRSDNPSNQTITENSGASLIVAAQDLTINATGTVLNNNSSLLAGDDITITADVLNNVATGITMLEERDIIQREIEHFVEDAGSNLCGRLGGPQIVPNSCKFDGFHTSYSAYTGREIVIGTEIVPVTSFLPTTIQAGGTLSITANQLGNGVSVDSGGPLSGGGNSAPTINGSSPLDPGTPGNTNVNFAGVTVPDTAAGNSNGASRNNGQLIDRGNSQNMADTVSRTGQVANGSDVTGPSGNGSVGVSGNIFSQGPVVATAGPVGGTGNNAIDVNPIDIQGSTFNPGTSTVNVNGPQSNGNSLDGTPTRQDLMAENAAFTDATLNMPVNAGGPLAVDPTLAGNGNGGDVTGNGPAPIDTTQKIVVRRALANQDTNDVNVVGAQNSDISAQQINAITGQQYGDPALESVNTANVLGEQAAGGAVSGNGGVLNAFAISSIADFDLLQNGFLLNFLDGRDLTPSEDGLGFDGQNTLFSFNNAPGAEFLFVTDPGLGSTADLFDSDFFFDSLGIDRSTSFTRLGDGFFEAQFISEQVLAATNQAQLPQYGKALEQAQGLMDAALAQQKDLGLSLGVALTKEQIASLNTSIVWWVTGEVAGTEVLIPVVYLASADQKEIKGGALLAGDNVVTKIAGAIDNTGTISATNIASIKGNSITNRDGGQIVGGTVIAQATQDIINRNASITGGTVIAQAGRDILNRNASISGGDVALAAGRDIVLDTTLSRSVTTSSNSSWKKGKRFNRETTVSNGLTGQSVVSASGNLSIQAGRDVNAISAEITAGGNASLTAERDINITGLTTRTQTDKAWKTGKRTHGTSSTSNETFTGSTITVGGDLALRAGQSLDVVGSDIGVGGNALLSAGDSLTIRSATTGSTEKLDERKNKRNWETRDITNSTNRLSNIGVGGDTALISNGTVAIRGGNLDTGGLAAIEAGNIDIAGVIDESKGTITTKYKKKGFLSSKKKTTIDKFDTDTVVQSNLTAGDGVLRSDSDISIAGANVAVDNQLLIDAQGNVNITALQEEDYEYSKVRVKKSGISIGSGGFFAGVAKNSQEVTTNSITNIGSLVGSSGGSVAIRAGESVNVTGSQIVAPGVIDIDAKNITIENELDVVDADTVTKSSSFGISIGAQAPVLSSATNAVAATKIAAGSKNDRVKAVASIGTALAAKNTLDAGKNIAKTIKNGEGSLGVKITASIGFSKSKSEDTSHDETVVKSLISGGDVALTAQGAGDASTIRITGSDIEATGDLALVADGAITAEAAQENDRFSGKSKSVGASLGVSAGVSISKTGKLKTDEGTITAAFNSSRSSYTGSDTSNIESNLSAGGTATVTTPGGLTLDGSTLSAGRVEVDAGTLDILSRQDTSTYDSKSTSTGISASFTPATGAASVSGNLTKGKQSGEFASVQEQAGIFAGKEGFDIRVGGETALDGGVIASEALDEAKNRLETGSLRLSDIENREEYSASQVGLSATLGNGGGTNRQGEQSSGTDKTRDNAGSIGTPLGNLTAGLPTAFSAGGEQNGVTRSAIAGGTVIVGGVDRSDDSSINRDTDSANDGALTQEFTDEKRAEIADGFTAAQILAAETQVYFANRAQEEKEALDEAERRQAAYDCGCEVGADNKPILVDADGNIVTDGSGVRVPLSAENYATYGGDKTVEGSAAYLNQQARDINETYGSGSATRIIATAFTGAAGSNVVGSLGGLVQSAAVNVLQSLTVNEVKEIADKLGDQEVHPDGTTTYRPNGTSEVIRGLLQGIVGCGGAAAGGSGDCGSAAVGASASAVVNHLINELIGANDGRKEIVRDEDGNIINDRNLEDQETRTNLITSLITAIAVTAGIDPASAANAARIETENNELAGQTFSGTCGSADPGCRAVATADYNLLAKIVGLNEAGLPVDAEGEVINATFVTGEPLDQRFYEDSLEGYQEAQAEARLIVLKALNPGYRTDEEYARYILSSPLRSSGLPGTADPRLDPNTIIQPTDDQITFILAASNFGDLNSPSAVNRVLDYYGGLENIDTGSDPTTLAYNLVEAHNQGKAAFERVGQNALARALVGEGQDSLNSAIAEINRLNDPANADEFKNLNEDERNQLLLAYNYAVNTGQVPRQLSTGERFASGADGVGNLVVGTALAAGAVLTSEACVSIAGCVIPVGLGAGSAVAFDTAAAQLNGAIDGYEQQTGGGYVATRVFRVDANTGELIYVAAQVSGGLLTGGIVGARNLPRAANRTATQADVAQHFQQNRRFWSSDPLQFNGNRVFQRNDLFDPNRTSTWVQNGQEVRGTNLQRMASGRAPIGKDGNSVNLHHLTQTQDGAIAEVTQTFHQQNFGVIHINTGQLPSGINRSQFSTWSSQYWINRAVNWGG